MHQLEYILAAVSSFIKGQIIISNFLATGRGLNLIVHNFLLYTNTYTIVLSFLDNPVYGLSIMSSIKQP